MELSFVISALKKRFWIIALFAMAGFVLGLTVAPSDVSYEAESRLVVRQPVGDNQNSCLLYTSPSPRDLSTSRMPSSA